MTPEERAAFEGIVTAVRHLLEKTAQLEHELHVLQERMLIYDAQQFAHEAIDEGIPKRKIN